MTANVAITVVMKIAGIMTISITAIISNICNILKLIDVEASIFSMVIRAILTIRAIRVITKFKAIMAISSVMAIAAARADTVITAN